MFKCVVIDKWGGDAVVALVTEHHLAKRFADLFDGFEVEEAAEQVATSDAPIVCPNGCPDVDICWSCGSVLQIVPRK